ncbi:coiled-coil domain-containing protein 152-like [Anneissia japonica]|uniref:coiled-coil domain-containing protein 152-like n=1 Tax=Anneissia japonica TaxID=1529436 RepID=UPI001425827D|nr:coiled-coil domain-containing protein 152-like [Anneissia japonica]
MSLRRNVNLDQLVQDIHNWQKQIDDLLETNQQLELQKKILHRQCENSEIKEKNAIEDANEMHKLVDKLQGILAMRCDIEDENRTLKDQIEDMQNKVAMLAKEHGEKEDKWKEERQEIIESHKEALANVTEDARIEGLLISVMMGNCADGQTRTPKGHQRLSYLAIRSVRTLQKQMADAEKAKHTEIIKLKLEYDSKISRLQKQATKAQQGSRSTSSNSNIFRQKLKFAKEESDKEILTLKRTIADLERKLNNQQTSKRKKF